MFDKKHRIEGRSGGLLLALCWAMLGVVLAGCSGRGPASSDAAIVFSAAASTTDAVEKIRDQFTAKTGYKVELNFDSTSTLAQQIMTGGDTDLFLSASARWADEVAINQRGASRVLRRVGLLSNRLVVVLPTDSPKTLSRAEDLLDDSFEMVALASPDAQVPAGVYAKEALEKLGLWQELKSQRKLVYGDDVRTALRYVETGSVPAGIIYATDAAASADVRVELEIDPSLHQQVVYPLLLLRHGGRHPGASELFDYVLGSESAAVFREQGFTVLPAGEAIAQQAETSAEDPE